MKTSEITYKPNHSTAAIALIVIAVVVFVVALLKTNQLSISLSITCVTIVLFLAGSYLRKQVVLIKINAEKQSLSALIQVWHKKKVIQLLLKDLNVTYKEEIGAKGTIRPSLRFYREDKLLLEIVPGISGWSNKTLWKIAEQIYQIKSGQ